MKILMMVLSLLIAVPLAAEEAVSLEQKLDILSQEVEKLKLGAVAEPVYKSVYGLAPAAAKVYHTDRGVSIGGYGEMTYQDFAASKDDGSASGRLNEFDFLRAVFYFGYKFDDLVVFNSETEIEHASTSGGSGARGEVSVEFAHLDFFVHPLLALRTGMVLVPVGLTNEMHEPTVFHGSRRPSVEQNLIPTTWRENGAGVFGRVGSWQYRSYVVAGLQAIKDTTPGVGGFSASSGIKGGRSKGAKSQAEDWAWTGRLDYEGIPGALIGGSFYSGDAGQSSSTVNGVIGAGVTLWDVHARWQFSGWELTGLYSVVSIADADKINAANGLTSTKSIGERQFGGYAQVAYDLFNRRSLGQSLSPFVRYERYDTQARVPEGFSKDPGNSRIEWTYGLTYKPHANTVIKVDFQDMRNQAGTAIDQWNMAVGYLY